MRKIIAIALLATLSSTSFAKRAFCRGDTIEVVLQEPSNEFDPPEPGYVLCIYHGHRVHLQLEDFSPKTIDIKPLADDTGIFYWQGERHHRYVCYAGTRRCPFNVIEY